MLEEIVLPPAWQVDFESYELSDDSIVLNARFVSKLAECTYCGLHSTKVHSRYLRQPFDLPLVGHPVHFNLEVRRFFCENLKCEKRTFTEQMPALVGFRQRRTPRQRTLLQNQAFALGGEPGARNLARMGVKISPDTLLRLVKSTPLPQRVTPRVLGVDDWAKRKGHNYGTILVNLEAHEVVDLLPDREAQTLADWLQLHPGIEIISRDRASAYADGARRGAPDAMQVADRFHLVKNLVDYLKAVFERKRASLRQVEVVSSEAVEAEVVVVEVAEQRPSVDLQVTETEVVVLSSTTTLNDLTVPQVATVSRKEELFDQIKQLKEQNYSMRLIALTLGASRQTVRKYLKVKQPPRYSPRVRHSKLDPYKPYLLARWQEGTYRRKILQEEICERGYRGSGALLGFYLAELNQEYPRRIRYRGWRGFGKQRPGPVKKPTIPRQLLSATQAAFLMIKEKADLEQQDLKLVEHLRKFDSELAVLYELGQDIVEMIRQRQAGNLGDWLKAVDQSETDELKSFATGIRQDRQAVEAGLTVEWSQGQVEGQVNRLKTIKRIMYGRAGFKLLKARVLTVT
jgi:transposase